MRYAVWRWFNRGAYWILRSARQIVRWSYRLVCGIPSIRTSSDVSHISIGPCGSTQSWTHQYSSLSIILYLYLYLLNGRCKINNSGILTQYNLIFKWISIMKHNIHSYFKNVLFCRFIVVLLPRDAMHKRGLCRHAVSVCLSVCDGRQVYRNEYIYLQKNFTIG